MDARVAPRKMVHWDRYRAMGRHYLEADAVTVTLWPARSVGARCRRYSTALVTLAECSVMLSSGNLAALPVPLHETTGRTYPQDPVRRAIIRQPDDNDSGPLYRAPAASASASRFPPRCPPDRSAFVPGDS